MQTQREKTPRAFNIYYFVMFMGMSIYSSFFSLYFTQAGMDAAQVGMLFGLAPLIGLISQPIWGRVADASGSKNVVLAIVAGCTAVVVLFFGMSKSFLFMSVMLIVFTSFNNCLVPLQDTITLDYISQRGGAYGPIRMWGTMGFAVMSVIVGWILNRYSDAIFITYFVLLVGTMLMALRLPRVRGYRRKGQKVKILPILKEPEMLLIILIALLLYGTMAVYYTFFGPYVVQCGGNKFMIGVASCLQAVSEVPFHYLARRWMHTWGIGKYLLIAALVQAVRWLLMGVFPNPVFLMLSPMLHGFTLVPLIVCVVEYINSHMPAPLKASGQMAFTIIGTNLSRVLGNMIGGVVVQGFNGAGLDGLRLTFLWMTPISLLAAFALGIPLMRLIKKRRAAEQQAADIPA